GMSIAGCRWSATGRPHAGLRVPETHALLAAHVGPHEVVEGVGLLPASARPAVPAGVVAPCGEAAEPAARQAPDGEPVVAVVHTLVSGDDLGDLVEVAAVGERLSPVVVLSHFGEGDVSHSPPPRARSARTSTRGPRPSRGPSRGRASPTARRRACGRSSD